jgi:hypothetical protein
MSVQEKSAFGIKGVPRTEEIYSYGTAVLGRRNLRIELEPATYIRSPVADRGANMNKTSDINNPSYNADEPEEFQTRVRQMRDLYEMLDLAEEAYDADSRRRQTGRITLLGVNFFVLVTWLGLFMLDVDSFNVGVRSYSGFLMQPRFWLFVTAFLLLLFCSYFLSVSAVTALSRADREANDLIMIARLIQEMRAGELNERLTTPLGIRPAEWQIYDQAARLEVELREGKLRRLLYQSGAYKKFTPT